MYTKRTTAMRLCVNDIYFTTFRRRFPLRFTGRNENPKLYRFSVVVHPAAGARVIDNNAASPFSSRDRAAISFLFNFSPVRFQSPFCSVPATRAEIHGPHNRSPGGKSAAVAHLHPALRIPRPVVTALFTKDAPPRGLGA